MQLLRRVRRSRHRWLRKLRFLGLAHYCPICGSHLRRFFTHGVVPRPNAQCPVCWSLERHRLLWLFVQQRTSLFDGKPKRLLHVAPEPAFAERLSRLPALTYVTADLSAPDVRVQLDITNVCHPDSSFDIVLCNHVLEHVSDDRRAMRELYRVLKPGGWALLQVPIMAERSFEDPSITSPEERERVFGQRDHVRRYGPDYIDRLEAVGFTVHSVLATAVAPARRMEYLGLMADHTLFFCTRS